MRLMFLQHFVTLVGHFRITANDKERKVGPGDMVAIEKCKYIRVLMSICLLRLIIHFSAVYYDIENLSDDIGILMVIKK